MLGILGIRRMQDAQDVDVGFRMRTMHAQTRSSTRANPGSNTTVNHHQLSARTESCQKDRKEQVQQVLSKLNPWTGQFRQFRDYIRKYGNQNINFENLISWYT